MINPLMDRIPRIEGDLAVLISQTENRKKVFLKSGQSLLIGEKLKNKYPLEAIQFTQNLSERTSVAHAIASVMALEDYLHLYPTVRAQKVRQTLLDVSAIRSHIYHFYWEVLPDYLNSTHFDKYDPGEMWFYSGFYPKGKDEFDLDIESGLSILEHVYQAAETIDLLQKVITLFGGKYPGIMNQIPGGITNFAIGRNLIMKAIRHLETCKDFIENIWPNDVKRLIQEVPETVEVLDKNSNLVSFGTLSIERNKGITSNYSEGILLNGKLGPVNELNITESIKDTYFLSAEQIRKNNGNIYDLEKPGARTWIKGARYQGEPMLTGALSRMMVTHLVGGNLEISDKISQMIDDLDLTFESPNCIASRLLSETLESRIYLKNTFKNLVDLHQPDESNRKTYLNFTAKGVGVGRVEAPSGSLLHQVFIQDGRIRQYRIVAPMNWNFSPDDENGTSGVLENSLNVLSQANKLTELQVLRLIHSYNTHVMDGTH